MVDVGRLQRGVRGGEGPAMEGPEPGAMETGRVGELGYFLISDDMGFGCLL